MIRDVVTFEAAQLLCKIKEHIKYILRNTVIAFK